MHSLGWGVTDYRIRSSNIVSLQIVLRFWPPPRRLISNTKLTPVPPTYPCHLTKL